MIRGGRFKREIVFFIFTLILVIGSASVQADSGKVIMGLNIGPVYSNHWSTEEAPEGVEKPKGESGISIGVYLNFSLGKRFSLQGELSYAERGAKHNILIEGFPYGPVDITYSTQYVELPIWLKFYVIKGEKFRLYTGAGGYVAFLFNGEYLFENEFIPSFTEDMNDIKKTDLGFLTTWGLELKLGGFYVHLEYRYSMSFADISYPTGPDAPGVDLRHLAHMVLFGVSFSAD